jgi:peptidoglycan/LPS O-acetylase OafA/YrhL
VNGAYYLVLAFFFGLATGIVGRIKGSSFFLWSLIGFCLPAIGLIAALLYRWERDEPRRQCPRCGAVLKISDQVCMKCGEDLGLPERVLAPPSAR